MSNKLKTLQNILNQMEKPLDELEDLFIDMDGLREPPSDMPWNVRDSMVLIDRAFADMCILKNMLSRQLKPHKKG